MIFTNIDLPEWKQEQIGYFKKYIKAFKKESREYKMLQDGIRELESSI